MKALYRRYRPTSLDDVIGQDQVIDPLQKSLKTGKLSHAYIFTGPRGTGKTSVARILAHAINKFDYEIEDDYIDIIEIDGASNRGIENVRELREKALIAPSQGKYKIYIIDEVHMFTNEAFNALLKILEEPPQHVIFIMATTDAHKVPSTIVSRSQVYIFHLSDQKTMVDFLRHVCDQEGIKINDEALDLLYKHGGGSFRDTLSLLDQISAIDDQEITAETIISALGLADQEVIDQLLEAYDAQDLTRIQSLLKDLVRINTSPITIASALVETITQNPQASRLGLLSDLIDITRTSSSYPEVSLLIALTKPLAVAPVVQAQPVSPSTQQDKVPQSTDQPNTQTKPKAQSPSNASGSNDLLQDIITAAKTKAPTIVKALENSICTTQDSTMTIYCNNDFYKKQLDRKRSFILEQLPENYDLSISDQAPTSSNIDNIKNMMGGGEVIKL